AAMTSSARVAIQKISGPVGRTEVKGGIWPCSFSLGELWLCVSQDAYSAIGECPEEQRWPWVLARGVGPFSATRQGLGATPMVNSHGKSHRLGSVCLTGDAEPSGLRPRGRRRDAVRLDSSVTAPSRAPCSQLLLRWAGCTKPRVCADYTGAMH